MLGYVVRPVGGEGGLKVEGKGKDGRVETTRLKKLGGNESGVGFLLSFFQGVCGVEIPTLSLSSLVCNFCVTIISTLFFLRALKEYILLVLIKHIDYLLTEMK